MLIDKIGLKDLLRQAPADQSARKSKQQTTAKQTGKPVAAIRPAEAQQGAVPAVSTKPEDANALLVDLARQLASSRSSNPTASVRTATVKPGEGGGTPGDHNDLLILMARKYHAARVSRSNAAKAAQDHSQSGAQPSRGESVDNDIVLIANRLAASRRMDQPAPETT